MGTAPTNPQETLQPQSPLARRCCCLGDCANRLHIGEVSDHTQAYRTATTPLYNATHTHQVDHQLNQEITHDHSGW